MKLYKITKKTDEKITLTNTKNKENKEILLTNKEHEIFNYDIYYNDYFLINEKEEVKKVCKNERHYTNHNYITHTNNCNMTHKDLKEFEKLTKATIILKDKQLTEFITSLNHALQETYLTTGNTINREVLDSLKTLIINKKKEGGN